MVARDRKFNSQMDPTAAQISISVGTIICSGVASAYVNHKLTSGRLERDLRRQKLEELYMAAHGYCKLLGIYNMVWPRVMKGELDYNQALDINRENAKPEPKYLETSSMLVNIYFRSLRPHLDAILRCRDDINKIQGDFKKDYEQAGEPDEAFLRPFLKAFLQIDQVEAQFDEALFKVADEISAVDKKFITRLFPWLVKS